MTIAKTFLSLLCLSALSAQAVSAQGSETDETSKLAFGATQYGIIVLLIESGNYDTVMPEVHKILELDFTGKNEKVLTFSLLQLGERLLEASQYSVAHQLVDQSLMAAVQERGNRFMLLMFKARVLSGEGKTRAAVEVYRRAQQLQD